MRWYEESWASNYHLWLWFDVLPLIFRVTAVSLGLEREQARGGEGRGEVGRQGELLSSSGCLAALRDSCQLLSAVLWIFLSVTPQGRFAVPERCISTLMQPKLLGKSHLMSMTWKLISWASAVTNSMVLKVPAPAFSLNLSATLWQMLVTIIRDWDCFPKRLCIQRGLQYARAIQQTQNTCLFVDAVCTANVLPWSLHDVLKRDIDIYIEIIHNYWLRKQGSVRVCQVSPDVCK